MPATALCVSDDGLGEDWIDLSFGQSVLKSQPVTRVVVSVLEDPLASQSGNPPILILSSLLGHYQRVMISCGYWCGISRTSWHVYRKDSCNHFSR